MDFEKKIESPRLSNKEEDIKIDDFVFVDEIDIKDSEQFNDHLHWRRKSIDDCDLLQQALKELEN